MTASNKSVALRDKQSGSSRKSQRQARLGRELYQKVWERVASTYIDPSRLGDWAKWQNRYDDQIECLKDAEKYIGQMLKSIGDDYTWLQTPDETAESNKKSAKRAWGIGVDVKVDDQSPYPRVEALYKGEVAADSGFRVDDEIAFVDGVSCEGKSLEQMLAMMHGPYASHIRVRLIRKGRNLPVKLMRRTVCIDGSVEAQLLPGRRVGVIKIAHFHHDDLDVQVRIALGKLRDAQALVLDLRSNEGGTINYGVDLLTFLMRSGPVATFEDRCKGGAKEMQVMRINTDRIMTHIKRAKRSRSEWRKRQKYLLDDRPLVVLVDKNTASTAELVAGTLKDNGFPVFGVVQTWGKAIGQEYVKLPGGYTLVVTGLRWFTPEGVWGGDIGQTMRIGVRPTYFIDPSQNAGAGVDVVLEEAVAALKRELRRLARTQ